MKHLQNRKLILICLKLNLKNAKFVFLLQKNAFLSKLPTVNQNEMSAKNQEFFFILMLFETSFLKVS
jgi:hypothetical protein